MFTPGSFPGCLELALVTPGSVLGCPGPPCGLLNDLWDTWDLPGPSPRPYVHPWITPRIPGTPLESPPECLGPPLGHPQDAWDPLGTPRSPLGCLGPPLHHSRDAWDPLWITPRISGSPLRCLSLLGGTLGGAPCAFTAQGTAPQQPRCRLPRGHCRRGAPFPCKNAPDVNSASRVLYRVGGVGEGWLRPPQPRPLPLYIYFSGFQIGRAHV